MTTHTESATALPLATLAATDLTSAAAIVKKAKTIKDAPLTVSLLSILRVMDNDKSIRAEVAGTALHRAYTLAADGQVSQIHDVITSTGNKVCERAMRQAVQEIGFGVGPGNVAVGKGLKALATAEASRAGVSLSDYIDMQVQAALSIFVGIACKPAKVKTDEEKAAEATAKATAKAQAEANALNDAKKTANYVELTVDDLIVKVVSLIGTGSLTVDQLEALDTALAVVAVPVDDNVIDMVLPQVDNVSDVTYTQH